MVQIRLKNRIFKLHEVRNTDRILNKKYCDVYGAVKALCVYIMHSRNKHSYKILIEDKKRNFLANRGKGLDVNIILNQIQEKLRRGNMNWIHIAHRLADLLLDTRFP